MSREFWSSFFIAIGTISSVVTLVSFVFQLRNPSNCTIFIYASGVILFSYIFAELQTYRKTKLTVGISNNLTIKVESGDLFSFTKDGNYVVIPMNEYFDTIVDDKIINAGSIHGQFINRYYPGDAHVKLHEEIEGYLNEKGIKGIKYARPNSNGYIIKYPLGTCVTINKDGTYFVLVSLTHFDDNDKAYVELSEFGRCISLLCHHLAKEAGTHPVYMPLMGMGLSRLNQSGQFILKYTLDSIIGVKDLALLGGLSVILYPPVAKTINLNEIKY